MISIITVVLNGERFIEYALQNIIDQACPDVEHVIIDGGSTDGTLEIIKDYAYRYSHIRWISEPDRGQSDALNKGIAMTKGQILGTLDYDDFYEPNVLNWISEIFKTLPEPSLLIGNTRMLLDDEDNTSYIKKPKRMNLLDLLSGRGKNSVCASSYFYHKSLLQKIGLYDLTLDYKMDVDFLYRAVQVASLKYVDEIFANRRHFQETKTVKNRGNGENASTKYIKQLPTIQRLRVEIYRAIFHESPLGLLFRMLDILADNSPQALFLVIRHRLKK
ncbi:glycosyltransferase family 2 protein [Coleofasciculus sp.]|uniref:glycosyltransferase family 2 protein n=1 Tax=Coleofasciculus sp. TaxID=3100458 RepID=UPI0039F88557